MIKKQEVARRLFQITEDKFDGILRQYALFAQMPAPTLKKYVDGTSIPGGESLARLAQAGGVTTDWILLGPDTHYGSEDDPDRTTEDTQNYKSEVYTEEEKQLIDEYRAASDMGKETGRVVFRMNSKDQKKRNHPHRRKTDPVKRNSVSG